jgi:uncharacterized protein DUF2628
VTVYSVHEPGAEAPDLAVRADRLAFVKEGFSWPAFFVPVLWLIYHRMWIELILLIVAFAALQWAFGTQEELLFWASLAVTVLFAFEANDLRTAALERRGYRLTGVVSGRDRADAELSFFRAWLPQQAKAARSIERGQERTRDSQASAPVARGESEEVIGLFPRP